MVIDFYVMALISPRVLVLSILLILLLHSKSASEILFILPAVIAAVRHRDARKRVGGLH